LRAHAERLRERRRRLNQNNPEDLDELIEIMEQQNLLMVALNAAERVLAEA
jgi:hypothetical protein